MEPSLRFSAADLVKRSCAQLVYFRDRKERALSRMAINGTAYQSKVVKDESLANIVADEMRGCYAYDGVEIFFCIDMIKNGEFYEIKSIQDKAGNETLDYPDWYFNSSILQCAFYKSLLLRMDGDMLFTPKFRVKEGYKRTALQVDVAANYYLKFGEVGVWKIDVTDADAIIGFYKNKISHITNYTEAREFDRKFRFHEFELLHEFFSYVKLDIS